MSKDDNKDNSQKEVYRKQISTENWASRSADLYVKQDQVGEGTFGKVYRAEYHDPENKSAKPEIVALKKILMDNEKEGFPITAIREITILKSLNHKNIIRLHEIVTSKPRENNQYRGNVYLVFEYMEHDFSGLADMKINFTIPCIKCIMFQILNGVEYLHKNNIIHRDIKSANILLNNKGEVKIADFGLARIINPQNLKKYTNRVVTLWYRAPELLLGETQYGPAIDMWSVGCLFSELLTGVPPFKGKKEPEQIEKIFEKCGTPNETTWPGITSLPLFTQLNPKKTYLPSLQSSYADNKKVDKCCYDLLSKMLELDPKKRINVKDAMNHPYFTTHQPSMCKPEELPKIEKDSHEYQFRKEMKAKNAINPQMANNLTNKGVVIGKQNLPLHNQQNGQIRKNTNNYNERNKANYNSEDKIRKMNVKVNDGNRRGSNILETLIPKGQDGKKVELLGNKRKSPEKEVILEKNH